MQELTFLSRHLIPKFKKEFLSAHLAKDLEDSYAKGNSGVDVQFLAVGFSDGVRYLTDIFAIMILHILSISRHFIVLLT